MNMIRIGPYMYEKEIDCNRYASIRVLEFCKAYIQTVSQCATLQCGCWQHPPYRWTTTSGSPLPFPHTSWCRHRPLGRLLGRHILNSGCGGHTGQGSLQIDRDTGTCFCPYMVVRSIQDRFIKPIYNKVQCDQYMKIPKLRSTSHLPVVYPCITRYFFHLGVINEVSENDWGGRLETRTGPGFSKILINSKNS